MECVYVSSTSLATAVTSIGELHQNTCWVIDVSVDTSAPQFANDLWWPIWCWWCRLLCAAFTVSVASFLCPMVDDTVLDPPVTHYLIWFSESATMKCRCLGALSFQCHTPTQTAASICFQRNSIIANLHYNYCSLQLSSQLVFCCFRWMHVCTTKNTLFGRFDHSCTTTCNNLLILCLVIWILILYYTLWKLFKNWTNCYSSNFLQKLVIDHL